ncbi:protein unc-79 homolog isoform X4 [Frankliniella occidentalis]|uniref:Protein unc-79 homolog isoform X4 n=1 Tax=Frankliniella occidentalis TaxID=133901 RepID=A0A9C6U1S1_FRAOC|nr:protein unc-79 homolog isoform X4 [Frankliniella occidentalis]
MGTMGTRAAAFTVKVRGLHDFHFRLLHGILPLPSGHDGAAVLKYFSQTLLTVLRDVKAKESPLEMVKVPESDAKRMALYPNLDYRGLYNAIVQLVDSASAIQYGVQEFGRALLQCLGCLLPFIENDMIDTLPYLTASTIAVLPSSLHQEIVNQLCYYVFPFTLTRKTTEGQETYASHSVAAILMLVFQYAESTAQHSQLMECLMSMKSDLARDVLCVIAHGSTAARASAAKLLFHYWPSFNTALVDRKSFPNKFVTDWPPFTCQRDQCPNAGNAEAAKVCYDHDISIMFANERPPPLYLCIECANDIHSKHEDKMFLDILHPMQQVSVTCESKSCRSSDKAVVSVCFSADCINYNGNHPIRFCRQCHDNRHNNRRGVDHIVHSSLKQAWDMDEAMQSYLVESIVNLLREAQWHGLEVRPGGLTSEFTSTAISSIASSSDPPLLIVEDELAQDERQLLGRYGVWLLVGLCTPNAESTPTHTLGRLLAMLFHWFHITAYSFDDQAENTLEGLKTDFVCVWLKEICKSHFNVLVSCLLPHPPDYSRVGGHWDTMSSRTCHLKDGLNRLFCLVPYEVVSPEIWDHVMPHWMESIASDVPPKELHVLKILLSKILDPTMSPLGFDDKQIYNFIASRFCGTAPKVQEQALNWLQILTTLEIVIPLPLLFSTFSDGISIMMAPSINKEKEKWKEKDGDKEKYKDHGSEKKQSGEKSDESVCRSSISRRAKPAKTQPQGLPWPCLVKTRGKGSTAVSPVVEDDSGNTSGMSDDEGRASRHIQFQTAAELNLSCCILMLDVLIKQMELQEVEPHIGITTSTAQDACRLLKAMVGASWNGTHTCTDRTECMFCESCVMWYQLALQLVKFLAPENPAHPPDPPLVEPNGDDSHKSPPDSDKKCDPKSDVVINMPLLEIHTVGGLLVKMPNIMTATVETVTEQLDLALNIPDERVAPTVARAITLTDTDVGNATSSVTKAAIGGENEELIDSEGDEDQENVWVTSQGKFHFSLDALPQHLQFIHQLLKEVTRTEEPDILYHMLQCLHVLVLHGDALSRATKEYRGFVIWCQENLLIKNLWDLCNSDRSHICEMSVPLLLHCITLPSGSDVFWNIIREDFHSADWRVRFTAVERVTVIARFMDATPLRNSMTLQAALATAFCYLVSAMDDINVHVSQRSTLYLGTIHDRAMKSLIMCLETQFDLYIVDRPMVLQSLYQLHNCLSDRKILTWEFFLNRFDTLFLEAQINLERAGDIAYPRDLRNTDLSSDTFIRKLNRAHEALSQSDSSGVASKTLSASFGHKWPYKRTMSAPAAMVPRQDTKPDGHIHSLNTGDDGQLVGLLHRIVDLEEADRETMHLLVFLLLQFLSRSDQASPSEESKLKKTQGIVLRHLNLLLGYNSTERERPGFHVPPSRLRTSPVFNVFMANLPQLLDQNHLIGKHMMPTLLLLMHYCPCPQQHSHTPDTQHAPHHSLWYLEPHTRRSWLMALIVLLYKYPYANAPDSIKIQSLVRIVLNTLDAQQHVCRRIPATLMVGAPPSRSRDVSQPSLGADGERGSDKDRMETPPLSPMYAGVDPMGLIHSSGKTGKHQALFHQKSPGIGPGASLETHLEEDDSAAAGSQETKRCGRRALGSSYSTEVDETESELAAIPESPKSDSTIHDTAQVSMDDQVAPAEEVTESKFTEHRCSLPGESLGNTVTPRRPIWFLGSEDNTLQKSMSIDQAGCQKWGVREGMKMMVNASLFGTPPQPPPLRPTTAVPSSSNGTNGTSGSVKQRSNSLGSSSSTLMTATSTSAAVTAATLATIALPRTSAQEQSDNDKDNDVWTGDQSSESPVQKSLGRQKCVDTSSTPTGTPSTPITTSAPSQLPSAISSMTHAPWQLDMYTKPSLQSTSPQPQPLQLATPAVERLLPIGGSRPCTKNSSRFRSDEIGYGSPESPLSKMEIMTIGSPVEIDSENNVSEVTSLHSIEIPPTERLLPIGSNSENVQNFVERVRQALGATLECPPDCNGSEQSSQMLSRPINDRRLSDLDAFLPPNKTESSDKSQSSRSISPRRLTKQVALESPPPQMLPDSEENHSFYRSIHDRKQSTALPSRSDDHLRNQRQKARRTGQGLFSTGHYPNMTDTPKHAGWGGPQLQPQLEPVVQQACHANFNLKQSSLRIGEDCVYDRCSECGAVREEYSDEELGLCIVILGTFIHREPALAAPLLPEMLSTIAKVSLNAMYPWQYDTNIYLPGGAISVAHQFLRCVLHQLAPNGIFMQMFQTHVDDSVRLPFFRSVAQALQDFNELSPIAPLQMLLEGLNSRKTLANDVMPIVLRNMACYLDCLPMDAGLGAILAQLEVLFRRLALQLQSMESVTPLLRIMISVLRIQGIASYKGILDPFSKVLSYSIQNFPIKYHYLVDLCYLCNRAFVKDRDKLLLTRTVVYEMVQALKFKVSMPDNNFLTLINFILQDAGGSLPLTLAMSQFLALWTDPGPIFNTGAAECMRQHLGDALDFLADFHTLSKIKSISKETPVGLNEDTLGGVIKSGIAQYVALEISRGNGRDNRAVARYLPWLYNAPSSLQQGPREFMDCLGHIRLLSWLLLGALTHTATHTAVHCSSHTPCQPVPQDASCHISDHIQAIMSGFAEQSKTSVHHMSSLFHAFILCQLWTVYLEQMASTNVPSSEAHVLTMSILLDFWGKVTPCILQLVSHSRILAEMANLHFLSLMEALMESSSAILNKLLPVWSPVLFAFHMQLPGHLQMRLQNCRNFPPSTSALPPPPTAQAGNQPVSNPVLLRWLQRLQFKMGQIEVQSSTATQFYSV